MLAANTAEWLAGVGSVTAAALLLAGIVFVGWQLWRSSRTRQAQLLADLSRRWDEPLLANARRRYAGSAPKALVGLVDRVWKDGAPPSKDRDELAALPEFFELLGALEGHGGLPIKIVNQLWGQAVITAWQQWQPAIKRIRALSDGKARYANFEGLEQRIQQRRVREAWLQHRP